MAKATIDLPHNWRARDYQRDVFDYLEKGGKRAVLVWHRRAGKDATCLNWAVCAAMRRVGIYWHMLPTTVQGRKVVWDGITKDGVRHLDAFPGWRKPGTGIVKHIRHDEMKIELANGSMWQVVGSDNYNSLVGSNPVGVVFSEYSVADPAAWDFIRPILAENGGWAVFPYTPRGRNHGYELYEAARKAQDWYVSLLTVEDTGAISLDSVDAERQAGMSDDMIQQEFYCSFDAALQGAYYARQMADALKDGRIGNVPHDPAVKVETWWDIGVGDATAIWFAQRIGQEVHLVDYYESSGEGLAHYAGILQSKAREHGYVYGDHVVPHDMEARELGTGKTRVEVARSLGLEVVVQRQQAVLDGIEAVRNVIPRCWFDEARCGRGIEALRQYRAEYDEKNQTFRQRPVHDWASHGADAFRYGALHVPLGATWGNPIKYPAKSGVV